MTSNHSSSASSISQLRSHMVATGIQQMIDNNNDSDTVEVVEKSNSKRLCEKETTRITQSNANTDEPLVFFRVYICNSDEDREIVSDPFLVAYKGAKSSIYKNIINGVVSFGKEEPIKLLFNPKRVGDTHIDIEYMVLDQSMFESTIDFMLKHSKNEIIDIKAVPFKKPFTNGGNGNTSIPHTTKSDLQLVGRKLLNRLEHAKTLVSDEVKVKINQITFTNNENQEIPVKELLKNNTTDVYLSFDGRRKRVTYQSSQEGIKIKTTSQEIIDFVNNQKTPVKPRKGDSQAQEDMHTQDGNQSAALYDKE